ncbi:MAG: glutathione S-transferase N-terminal domain-containing protein [Gammaproteobacteria bacterium]|nr:glutathione S-transferase N-terminal domain-containing protein [Gammaproteobacteria bacterium]
MTTLTLYDTALSWNCHKVRLLLSLLGVHYERVPVDLLKGEHKTPEFLSINPFGQVPMLEADGRLIRNSQAILVWLSRKYDDGRWLPGDPDDEAEVNAWLAAATFELRLGPDDARLAKLYPLLCVNAQLACSRTAHALELYNRRLASRNWLALARPTLADVAAFPAIS